MQTPAILNVSAAPGPSPSVKPTEGGDSDSSFNQMLSQQIDQRRAADNANNTGNADNNQAAKADDANKASNDSGNAANKANAANQDKDTDGAADAAAKVALAKKKAAADDDKSISAADAVLPSVTDMIALANGNALKGDAKPADDKATAVNTTATVGDVLAASVKGKGDAAAAVDAGKTDDAAAIGKAAVKTQAQDGDLKAAQTKTGPDFKTALTQAKDAKDTNQPADRASAKADDKALNAQAPATAAIQHAAADKVQDKAMESAVAKLQDAPAVTTAMPQVQQAALHVAQAASVAQTDTLAPQVGTTAWNQALGQKVVWMVNGAQQSASLTLNPPDLGPLQVVLSVNNGHADASFFAPQPEVRQALEAAMPTLRDMMGGAGIQLGQATVSAGMPDQRQAEQQAQQGSRNFAGNDKGSEIIAPIQRQTAVGGVGLVDTFA